MPGGLEKVFDFDEAEILLNQNGRLSEKQLKRLKQYRRIQKKGAKLAFGAIVLTTLFWLAMWLWGIGIKYDAEKHLEISLAFFAALSIVWLLFFVFTRLGAARSDLKSGKISSVRGFAEHRQKKLARGLGTAYFVKIGGVKFRLETQTQFLEIKPAAEYHFFYVKRPPLHIILSVSETRQKPL